MGVPTKHCKAAIVCHYLCGDTYQQVMERCGIRSLTTVYRAVNESGLKRGLDIDCIMELYASGNTPQEIADKVGCDRSTVGKVLRKAGIHTKSAYNARQHAQAVARRGEKRKTKDSRWRWWCKKTGAAYDPHVGLDALIERDGLICNMCGIECSTEDDAWGTYGPTYPTLDHIVPLSKGGSHTWDNVQLLCGNCNCVVKRDA